MFWQLIFFVSSSLALQPTCNKLGKSRAIRLSVNSTKLPTGVWMDGISAWVVVSNSLNATQMEIVQTITECEGGRILHIQGETPVPRHDLMYEKLKFHPNCGENVAILDNSLSAQRIQKEIPNEAVLFTNRPLKDGEVFEIKIEERNDKFNYAGGIGIITISPTDAEIPSEIHKSPFAWTCYGSNLYNNGTIVVPYVSSNNYVLLVGDSMGVMRSEVGTLHFFINGEDQGPAKSNVPPNVYGVLDLRQNIHKASIV